MTIAKIAPWVAAVLALAGAGASLLPRAHVHGFDLEGFSRLPVLEGGRVKPIDSIARNSLLLVRGRQAFTYEGRTVGADEWLLDVLFRPEVADAQPVFFIDDPEVLALLGVRQSADRYFSFQTLAPHLEQIERQADAARQIDAKQRTRFQRATVNLFDRIYLYFRLQNTLQPKGARLADQIQAASRETSGDDLDSLDRLAVFRPLWPSPRENGDAWRSIGAALRAVPAAIAHVAIAPLAQLGAAYRRYDPAMFDLAVHELTALVRAERPEALTQTGHEWIFNRAEPFYAGMVIYVLALIAVFVSWLSKREILQPAAFGLLAAGAFVHTAGLVSRVVLQGRPPVTNLYSSAVFVGWTAVIAAIALERMYRRGIATAVGAAAGFASLIVAHHLSADGDTMEMMRAVLDSNFWLATHVVTITIGYSGTFLAGAFAIGYALRRQFVPRPDPTTTKMLVSMTYGTICFGLFFSFIGTVLGGIWADQSWGRFWGWDPKENGALLIVLWNALILHTRWGGYIRERGLMAMAVFGNVITSLSWFGVNMLGVGLHSYGFMDSAFWALSAFIASQLVLVAACLVPRQFWKPRTTRLEEAVPEARLAGIARE